MEQGNFNECDNYDVFISYSRRDYVDSNNNVIPGNVISAIRKMFDAKGITYWFDKDGVYSGDAFAPLIAKNIKSSKIFLFISSKNSNASEWTSNEIATARQYKKKIIPFKYDDSIFNDSVIIYIACLDYIEYFINPSDALNRLLVSVQKYLHELKAIELKQMEEAERLRKEEFTKKEREKRIAKLREEIKTLHDRMFEIDKEILIQEKNLSDLRSEKRIVDACLQDLKNEQSRILGLSVTPPSLSKEKSENKEFDSRVLGDVKCAGNLNNQNDLTGLEYFLHNHPFISYLFLLCAALVAAAVAILLMNML